MAQPPRTEERRLRMSYEEFLAWAGEDTDAEWVDGQVTDFMPPTGIHQDLAGFLYIMLRLYARFFGLGAVRQAPFEMRLERSSREPDILFVARRHLDRLSDERLLGPADLVVELISDESVRRDRVEKRAEYEAAGVLEYWLFDRPEGTRPGRHRAEFYRLSAAGRYEEALPDAEGRYHSTVLPGFWLKPDWLWQDPPPDPLACLVEIAPQVVRNALATGSSSGHTGDA